MLSGFVGVRTIHRRVVEEAQERVTLDLSSAWAVYSGRLECVEIVLRNAAARQTVVAPSPAGPPAGSAGGFTAPGRWAVK